jgi:hypothetical protein
VVRINGATMSYAILSGNGKFYFSLETKARHQMFPLYSKVYFGKRYEERAKVAL